MRPGAGRPEPRNQPFWLNSQMKSIARSAPFSTSGSPAPAKSNVCPQSAWLINS